MTPINSIKIPFRFKVLCNNWAGDSDCMLRAIASTGGLSLGTIQPLDCETEEQWYYSLWQALSADIAYNRRLAGEDHQDYQDLVDFEAWTDSIVEQLALEYGIE